MVVAGFDFAGERYGPTAKHLQDCLIFFIQLTYVHKLPCHKVAPRIPLPLPVSQFSHIT